MIVLQLNACTAGLRGDVTKWLMEIAPGVYVGQLSMRTREALWQRVCKHSGGGSAVMVCTARNEQGFVYYVHNTNWKPIDFDGVTLMQRTLSAPKAKNDDVPDKAITQDMPTSGESMTPVAIPEAALECIQIKGLLSDDIHQESEAATQLQIKCNEDNSGISSSNGYTLDEIKTGNVHLESSTGVIAAGAVTVSDKLVPESGKRKTHHKRKTRELPYVQWPDSEPLPTSFSALDIETTGLAPECNEIIEIACIHVREGKIKEKFQCLVNTRAQIPDAISKLTGITDQMISQDGVPLREAIHRLLDFLGDDWIVGHYTEFDIRFLLCACTYLKIPAPIIKAIDTINVCRKTLSGKIENFRLETIIQYLGLADKQSHRALPDALLAAQVYLKLNENPKTAN